MTKGKGNNNHIITLKLTSLLQHPTVWNVAV